MTAPKPQHLLIKRRRMVTETTKQCKACEFVKDVSEFQRLSHPDRPGNPHYWAARCKVCAAEYNRTKLYGISLVDLIAKQGSPICPLCLKRLAVCIDHDHQTGQVRGAICQTCNKAMCYVDNREWLERAEKYRCQPNHLPSVIGPSQ